jgi:hypothetical protein
VLQIADGAHARRHGRSEQKAIRLCDHPSPLGLGEDLRNAARLGSRDFVGELPRGPVVRLLPLETSRFRGLGALRPTTGLNAGLRVVVDAPAVALLRGTSRVARTFPREPYRFEASALHALLLGLPLAASPLTSPRRVRAGLARRFPSIDTTKIIAQYARLLGSSFSS